MHSNFIPCTDLHYFGHNIGFYWAKNSKDYRKVLIFFVVLTILGNRLKHFCKTPIVSLDQVS